ncbi:MAG: translation initiation factor IF-2 [Synechococcaceae cyanobacterium SM2_3_1]|nr:translation initiation factor IF-2 [Synechococcaceae cyanobacterium SM2_3_1]
MGFADLSIAELAEDYQLNRESVLLLCEHLGIPHQDAHSLLSLEDAKRIILASKPPTTSQSAD